MEQPKSLEPTNMPMEGCDIVTNFTCNDDTLNNNGYQLNQVKDSMPKEPEKKKPRRPIPGLVKIKDLKSPEAAEAQEPRIPPIRVRTSISGHPVILSPKTTTNLMASTSPTTFMVTSPIASIIQVPRLAPQLPPATPHII